MSPLLVSEGSDRKGSMKVDWQRRHDDLADYVRSLQEKVRETENVLYRIRCYLEESERLALSEQGSHKFLELKEDVVLTVEYDYGRGQPGPERKYPAGTLIDARITGNYAAVYLDEDGDGYLYFPADKLQVVVVKDEYVDWDKVVSQG